jgi:HEAT repeat protein
MATLTHKTYVTSALVLSTSTIIAMLVLYMHYHNTPHDGTHIVDHPTLPDGTSPQVSREITRLYSPDRLDRESGVIALGEMGQLATPAIPALITMLGELHNNAQPATAAREALVKIGTPAVEALIVCLQSRDKDTRWGAAMALGEIKDNRAVDPLVGLLADRDSDLREAAGVALGKIQDRRAVEHLINALEDKNWRVRCVVIDALGD